MAIAKGPGGPVTRRFKGAKFKQEAQESKVLKLSTHGETLRTSRNLPESSTNKLKRFLYIFLTFVASCCYMKSVQGEFVYDDILAVKNNFDVQARTSISELFLHDFWGQPMNDSTSHKSYRPLCVLSFRLQFWLHGFDAFWFRLVNLCLHVLVTLKFAHVCKEVLGCTSLFSFLTGLLFAVHPIHSEAVCAVVGRADILSCLFFLVAFQAYVNCTKCSSKDIVDENRNYVSSTVIYYFKYWISFALCIIAGGAAMLTKETGITVFGVCVVYDVAIERLGNCRRRGLFRICILTTLVVFLLYLRFRMQNFELPRFTADENPAAHSDCRLTRLLTYSYLCFYNAWLLLVPTTLCYDWQMASIHLVESLFDLRNFATFAFFVVLVALLTESVMSSLVNEERKVLFTGLLFLTIPFLPASNLFFPVGFVIAERVLYIPSLGYCLIINFGFAKLAAMPISVMFSGKFNTSRFKVTCCCYVVILVWFISKTWQQNTVWQGRGNLFRSGVKAAPQNAKVHYNYANYLKDVGKNEAAIQHYRLAIQLSPHYASSHNNLGKLLGNSEEAIKHFKLAIKYDPRHVNAHLNLGTLLSFSNQLTESEMYLKKLLRFTSQPAMAAKALTVLTDVLSRQARAHEVDKLYEQTFQTFSSDASLFNNYGLFLIQRERHGEALVYYDKAITLVPKQSAFTINKAHALFAIGKIEDAESVLKTYLEGKEDSLAFHELGILYYKTQRLSDAENSWLDALKLDPNLTDTLFNYGILLKRQRRLNEAVSVFSRCLRTDPTSLELHQDIIPLFHHMGYLTEALNAVNNILTSFNVSFLHYERGNILKDLKLYQDAIKAYEMAIELNLTFTDAYLNLGATHHILRNIEDARSCYEYVLKLDSTHKLAKENLERLTRLYEF